MKTSLALFTFCFSMVSVASANGVFKAKPVSTVTNPSYDKRALCLDSDQAGYSTNGTHLNGEIAVINVDPISKVPTLDMPSLRQYYHSLLAFDTVMRENMWGNMAYISEVKFSRDEAVDMSLYPEGGLSWMTSESFACSGPVAQTSCAKFHDQNVCVGDLAQIYADAGPNKITKIYSYEDKRLAAFRIDEDEARVHAEGRGEYVRIKMKFEGTKFITRGE